MAVILAAMAVIPAMRRLHRQLLLHLQPPSKHA
jgi:hypothetical protein